LSNVVHAVACRSDSSGVKNTLSLLVNLLSESGTDDSFQDQFTETVSSSLFEMFQNSSFLEDDMISVLDNIRSIPLSWHVFEKLFGKLLYGEQDTNTILGKFVENLKLEEGLQSKALCCYTKLLVKIFDCIASLKWGNGLEGIQNLISACLQHSGNVPEIPQIVIKGLIQAVRNANTESLQSMLEFLYQLINSQEHISEVKNFYFDLISSLCGRTQEESTMEITAIADLLGRLNDLPGPDVSGLIYSADKLSDLINGILPRNYDGVIQSLMIYEDKILEQKEQILQSPELSQEVQQVFIKAITAFYKKGSENTMEPLLDQTRKLLVFAHPDGADEIRINLMGVFNPDDDTVIQAVSALFEERQGQY
jgi:hypothetical protein